MADNVVAGAAVGTGPTFAADDIGGVHHARAKVEFGVDGAAVDVSASNPLPVVQTGTPALPTGAATAANQATEIASLATLAGAVAGAEVQVDVLTMPVVAINDNGGSVTVDGTVTANAGTGTFAVSAAALPLPSGAATAAKQPAIGTAGASSTDVLSVQGIASGTAMPVSAAALPLPSGASTESTLAAMSAKLPAALDGSGNLKVSIQSGGSGGTQYAEDAVHASGDLGTMALMVRKDTATALAGADGDYAPGEVDASGRLWVNGSSVTQPVSDAGGSLTMDSAQLPAALVSGRLDTVIGAALPAGSAIIGKVGIDQTTPGTTNLVALAANQSVNVAQINGVTALMGAGATGTGSQRVTLATDGQGQVVDNAGFTDGTTRVDMNGFIFDEVAGTALTENDAAAARIDSKRAQVFALEDATTRGQRQAVNSGGAAEVHGDAAHDAAIAGNPVRIGARAMSTDFTAVGTGDAVDVLASLLGKTVILTDALPANTWSYAAPAGGLVNTTGVTAKAAAGAGIRNYVSKAQIINSHQTIGTEVLIRDGAAGTVLWRGWAQFTGGGAEVEFKPPLRGSVNTLIEIQEVTTTGTAGVLVNLQGFVAAE